MLVLSRKKGESVVVNGNITIVVVDVRGDKARIGIEAPADVVVYRSEILEKNAAANEGNEAAQGGEVGEVGASKTFRKAKPVGETSKRGKSGGVRGARKKAAAPSEQNGENAVETLYLSSESEAYRRSDAAEGAALEANERDAANVGVETSAPRNYAK